MPRTELNNLTDTVTVPTLPDELWSGIFELLCPRELYAASQVCMHWRCVAFDHQRFWGHIDVTSLSPCELGWTAKRIAAGGTQPINFRVCLTTRDSSDLEETILPLIQTVLHRARGLRIILPNRHFKQLFQILRGNAPILEQFWLDMSPTELEKAVPNMVLPSDIFGAASSCPLLRDVHLKSIRLPSTVIPAFRCVQSVLLASADGGWHHIPTDLFDHFPSVQTLALVGGGLLIAENAALAMDQGFARLAMLAISYYETENMRILRRFPAMRAIPDIVFSHSDGETVRTAVAQLCDRLMLVLTQAERSIRVLYSSHDGKRRRAFTEDLDDFEPEQTNAVSAVLSEPTFNHRVVSLRIAASLWHIAIPFLSQGDNHFEELIVVLEDDDAHGSGAPLPCEPRLRCPRLRILAFHALGALVRLSVSAIVVFARGISQDRLSLGLHLVVISGAREELNAHFETILYSD